jgi:hypothetical protein
MVAIPVTILEIAQQLTGPPDPRIRIKPLALRAKSFAALLKEFIILSSSTDFSDYYDFDPSHP